MRRRPARSARSRGGSPTACRSRCCGRPWRDPQTAQALPRIGAGAQAAREPASPRGDPRPAQNPPARPGPRAWVGRAEVRDTGIGIGPELLPRVFELFVQDPQAIDRRDGGLGIGLAIVKNLVVRHGGSVGVHGPGPGQGSVFSIRLPLVAVAAPPTPPRRPVAVAPGRRLLVVDDNVEAAEMLGDLLRAHRHDVSVVHHPDDAIAGARLAPEIALLDIGLPGMDGYELATRLRALLPSCRLIALTGYGQANERARGAAAGFDAYLVKPARLDDLLAVIADRLPQDRKAR